MLLGVAQAALDVARGYALEREQFGVPIGSFQAVKHLLADMYVRDRPGPQRHLRGGRGAATTRSTGDADRAAATAKLLAGEAALRTPRGAIQVHGGMGFTWEMLPHYFLKRAWVLEDAFGDLRRPRTPPRSAVGREASA